MNLCLMKIFNLRWILWSTQSVATVLPTASREWIITTLELSRDLLIRRASS